MSVRCNSFAMIVVCMALTQVNGYIKFVNLDFRIYFEFIYFGVFSLSNTFISMHYQLLLDSYVFIRDNRFVIMLTIIKLPIFR